LEREEDVEFTAGHTGLVARTRAADCRRSEDRRKSLGATLPLATLMLYVDEHDRQKDTDDAGGPRRQYLGRAPETLV
jgi:hypothetical protein